MGASKWGFQKLNISEFENWVGQISVGRTIRYLQQHHTWSPDYAMFNGKNYFDLQQAMKNHHVNTNGWMDIGQHFTTFPDGSILTGRSLENTPAGIFGFNTYALCIEHFGNFDSNKDQMTIAQQDAIVGMTAILCQKFSIPVNSAKIVYHHWFNLATGDRNNGANNNKTCPGTNFFGGNKVANYEENFSPKVNALLSGYELADLNSLIKYVYVTANKLNIREKANANSKIAGNPVTLGSILGVYEVNNGWLRISISQQRWVKGTYTKDVERYLVNASALNVRSGPSTNYQKINTLARGQEIFITEEKNGWCKLVVDNQWVNKAFLSKK